MFDTLRKLGLLRCVLCGCLGLAAVLAAGIRAGAQEAPRGQDALSETQRAFFEQKIRPVLVERCYKCHSTDSGKRQGGFQLDWRDGIRKGGDSGPAVVPGDVDASLLISAIRYESYEMPPDGQLPDSVIADVVKWIEMGAPDPRDAPSSSATRRVIDLDQGRAFWCFQPLARAAPPTPRDRAWSLTTIDRWVLDRLEREGIRPLDPAPRAVLVRRLYFDLLGLPPAPDEIDAFVNDRSPDAWPRLVDRLLASPRFGEHWARHWLDVARYAESTGGGRTLLLPDAWRYRDYVIRAMNGDKPYDRFIVEQIAGDLLPPGGEQDADRLIATAYLALGPTNYERQDKDILEMDVIDEQLDTIGKGILAMTIGCARCHDHKFDPIPTADYYALAGIFKSTQTLIHDNVSAWVTAPLPAEPELEARLREHDSRVSELKSEIAALKRVVGKPGTEPIAVASLPGIVLDDSQAQQVGSWMHSTFAKPYVGDGYRHDENQGKGAKTLTFVPPISAAGDYEVRLAYTPGTNRASNVPVTILHTGGETTRTVDQRQPGPIDGRFVSLGQYTFDTNGQWFVLVSNVDTDGHVIVDAVQFIPVDDPAVTPADPAGKSEPDARSRSRKELDRLEAELKRIEKNAPQQPTTMSVRDAEAVTDFYICVRGSLTNRGPDVARGFLSVVAERPPLPADASGRLELAEWMTGPAGPLAARVISNRVWHWLTGTGLVRTVDNFGEMGERPSHPELLDDLAAQLIDSDWSIKSLVREIVLSRTYQLSAGDSPEAAAADPENRWHWRRNRRRLNAEELRDAMLVASGRLRWEIGGPNIKSGTTIEYGYAFDDTRRTVYAPIFRNTLLEILEVFDFADPNRVHGRRSVSTTATQALYLMNHPFVMAEAEHAARRALALPSDDDAARLRRSYRETLGRDPTVAEIELGLTFLRTGGASSERARWTRYYHTLLSSLDFRFVD